MAPALGGMPRARYRNGARTGQGSRTERGTARTGANAGGSALFLKYDPLSSRVPPLDCFPFDSK